MDKALINKIMIDIFEKFFKEENHPFVIYGRNNGLAEGEIIASEKHARRMFQKGLDILTIQEITGLDLNRLGEIQRDAPKADQGF